MRSPKVISYSLNKYLQKLSQSLFDINPYLVCTGKREIFCAPHELEIKEKCCLVNQQNYSLRNVFWQYNLSPNVLHELEFGGGPSIAVKEILKCVNYFMKFQTRFAA